MAAWAPIITLSAAAFTGTKIEHPAPGTSIVRFTELDANVYKRVEAKKRRRFRLSSIQTRQIFRESQVSTAPLPARTRESAKVRHDDIGRDRTSLIATLYRMYFGNLASQDALQEMKEYGFKDSWTLLGLKKYLMKHPKPPAALASVSHTCLAAPSQSVGEISRRP